jgi:ADP-ribose pyrophosphatase YjhB (NUDIX family)
MAYQPKKNILKTGNTPITSYGILLFFIDDANKVWYLLAQRRDTIEYADFIRGRYTYLNLETYFSLMTKDERKRLTDYSFNELWDDLWINHDNRYYRDIKPRAKTKFESSTKLITNFLNNTTSNVDEPGWGFPKGKKNANETQIECAFREFNEETKISIDYLNLQSIPPVIEVFKGSNGKMYSTVYYIAKVNQMLPIKKIKINGLRTETISEEIANLRWCTLDMTKDLLPRHRYETLANSQDKINRARKGSSIF